MKQSWISVVAVFFVRMAGARRAWVMYGAMRLARTSIVLVLFAGVALLFAKTIRSQTIKMRSHNVNNGERLFKSGCITCHGADGRGAPQTLTEFQRPDTFPDFTRCDQTTPEPNSVWKDVILHGGPPRGCSHIAQTSPLISELRKLKC